MKNNLYKIITLGALWGIFEASIGYLLHLSGMKIGWMIWFPVAYFFIHKAYSYTKNIHSVMLSAVIAAALKMINLFFPGRIDTVINPAVSIIIEALAVMLVYHYVINKQLDKINPFIILLTGLTWRMLYICYIFYMPQSYMEKAPFITMNSFLKYMMMYNFVNTLFIWSGFMISKRFKNQLNEFYNRLSNAVNRNAAVRNVLTALSVIAAVMIQILTR